MPEIGRTPIKSALSRATVGSEGARLIGAQLSGYAGATVQALLESIKTRIENKADLTHAATHAEGGTDPIAAVQRILNTATALTKRNTVNFGVGITAADDSTNNRTNVTVAQNAAAATPSLRQLGAGATDACAGNDARLSDARTPTAHSASHLEGGSDPVPAYRTAQNGGTDQTQRSKINFGVGITAADDSVNNRTNVTVASGSAAATPSLRALGTASTEACAGNDSRLSDTRTPKAHAASHAAGGSDPVAAYKTITSTSGTLPQRSTLHIVLNESVQVSDDSTNERTVLNVSNYPNMQVLGADVVNNNATANTFQDVTGLSFFANANVTYRFRAMILFETDATTTGSRWSCNGPAITRLRYRQEWNGATLGTTSVAYRQVYDIGTVTTDTPGAGGVAFIEGILTPSASGTFVLRFASEVASAAVTAKAGSILEWW